MHDHFITVPHFIVFPALVGYDDAGHNLSDVGGLLIAGSKVIGVRGLLLHIQKNIILLPEDLTDVCGDTAMVSCRSIV